MTRTQIESLESSVRLTCSSDSLFVNSAEVHGANSHRSCTPVRAIVLDNQFGESPEQIVANRPHLSIEQVHAALAYYHANKQAVDHDIEAENRAYEEGAAAARRLTNLALQNPVLTSGFFYLGNY